MAWLSKSELRDGQYLYCKAWWTGGRHVECVVASTMRHKFDRVQVRDTELGDLHEIHIDDISSVAAGL